MTIEKMPLKPKIASRLDVRVYLLLLSLPLKWLFSTFNGLGDQFSNTTLSILGVIFWITWFSLLWTAATHQIKSRAFNWTWLPKVARYSTFFVAAISVFVVGFSLATSLHLVEADSKVPLINNLIVASEGSL